MLLEASPRKKQHIEVSPYPGTVVLGQLHYWSLPNFLKEIEDVEDDMTTAQTPNSAVGSNEPESPITVATTPRPKFPSDLKTLACTWPGCPKTFNRPARLRDHLNSHTNSRPFVCPYDDCDKDYIEDKHLKQHIKAVHKQERKHVCQREGCGKSFVTSTRLKRHQAVHEGANRFRCVDCGQSFRKKETLHRHVLQDHKGLPPHQCHHPGCSEAFEYKGSLRRHEQKAHGELKYWCGECGLQKQPDGTDHRIGFTTDYLLQQHMRQEHQGCMFCDFKSAKQGDLEAHIDAHHSGKTLDERKTVLCPYENCTKRFTKKSNLTTHIRASHEGVRFICGETPISSPGLDDWHNGLGCGDKFSTKIRLEDHIRYVHLGQVRPRVDKSMDTSIMNELVGFTNMLADVSCPHCPALFKRYHDLNKHMASGACPGLLLPIDAQLMEDLTTLNDDGMFSNASQWDDGVEDEDDDGIFAAGIDYDNAQDEWLQDEANIMLLARDSPIDPNLSTL